MTNSWAIWAMRQSTAALAALCFFVTFAPAQADDAQPVANQTPAPKAATAAEPAVREAQTAAELTPAPPDVRRIQMRLSGSSCTACLRELERKMKAVSGISKCKIEYPGENLYQAVPGAGWSLATIVADVNKVSVQQIVQFMKTQGYHAFKIIDKGPAA
jgi:copper chaperone CopZ